MSRFFTAIIICAIIFLGVGGYFLWWPNYQELKTLRAELTRKEMLVQQKKEYFSKLAADAEKLNNYEEEMTKINEALPDDLSIANLFKYIIKTTAENGLVLKDVSGSGIAQKEGGSEVQRFPFSFTALGSYPSLKNLLQTIYKNTRLIEISSISFSSPKGGSSLFEFNFGGYAHYYRKPEETVGGFPEDGSVLPSGGGLPPGIPKMPGF